MFSQSSLLLLDTARPLRGSVAGASTMCAFWLSKNFILIEADICHDFWLPIFWISSPSLRVLVGGRDYLLYRSRKCHLLSQLPLQPYDKGAATWARQSQGDTPPSTLNQRCTDAGPAENSPWGWVHSSAADKCLHGTSSQGTLLKTRFSSLPCNSRNSPKNYQ